MRLEKPNPRRSQAIQNYPDIPLSPVIPKTSSPTMRKLQQASWHEL